MESFDLRTMEAKILTVHWHDESAPVYTLAYQPNLSKGTSERLVSGGGDNNIRIWKLYHTDDGEVKLEYLSTLSKHSQAVNVVRFNPTGEILATAGDDGMVLLWTKADSIVKEFDQDAEDLEDIKESWTLLKTFRSSSSEVYDLCWSADSRFIVTGSTDNIVRIYDVKLGTQVNSIDEHNHFVQGVAFDPRGEFIVSQSADRSIHVNSVKYDLGSKISLVPSSYFKISRVELPTRVNREEGYTLDFKNGKNSMLYHTENLESFFRRLTFSPDGLFLFTPSGIYKPNPTNNNTTPTSEDSFSSTHSSATTKEDIINTVYIYSRQGLNKPPVAHIPNLKKPAIAISFSPIYYALSKNSKSIFNTPYKLIYAVLTQDTVLIFDTTSMKPIGSVSGIHYRTLTDLTWNQDGMNLVVSSADGFCSTVRFKTGVFGEKLVGDYRSLLTKGGENPLFSSVKLNEAAGDKSDTNKREVPDAFNLMAGSSVRKKPKHKPSTAGTEEKRGILDSDASDVTKSTEQRVVGLDINDLPTTETNLESTQKSEDKKGNQDNAKSDVIEIVSLSDEDEIESPSDPNSMTSMHDGVPKTSDYKQETPESTPTPQKKKTVDIFSQLAAKSKIVHSPPIKKKAEKRIQPTVVDKS